jgi:hypothetical protein
LIPKKLSALPQYQCRIKGKITREKRGNIGAGEGIQILDLNLGKVAKYQYENQNLILFSFKKQILSLSVIAMSKLHR